MLTRFLYESVGSEEMLYRVLQEENVSVLAGGTDLLVDIRCGRACPRKLIDIKGIEAYRKLGTLPGGGLSIGASVTLSELAGSEDVLRYFPVLADAAREIGSLQLRNRATVMGNLCNASPGCDMAPALLACGASVELAGAKGKRTVPLETFFTGVKKTVKESFEVAERILVSPHFSGGTGKMLKLRRIKGHDLALVSAALVRKSGRMRIAAGACAPTPVFIGEFSAQEPLETVLRRAEETVSPIDDVRASAEYRMFMLKTYLKRLYHGAEGNEK